MEKTTHYQLNKPEAGDPVRMADFNANADIIDTALNGLSTEVAAVSAKANAAYGAEMPPATCITMDTTGKAAGATVYTFERAPKFVILRGNYQETVVLSGATGTMYDYTLYNTEYKVTFQLSGRQLIMTERIKAAAATSLTIAAFY